MEGRPVRESVSQYIELAQPNDANILGTVQGGKVAHMVDLAGAMAAMRHARCPVVTASIDLMNFLHPIYIGQLIVCHAAVNRAFRSSMEVGVKVMVEDPLTGEVKHTCSAYLTFVAIDKDRNKIPVPPVIPETEDEKRRWRNAEARRNFRLSQKRKELEREAG